MVGRGLVLFSVGCLGTWPRLRLAFLVSLSWAPLLFGVVFGFFRSGSCLGSFGRLLVSASGLVVSSWVSGRSLVLFWSRCFVFWCSFVVVCACVCPCAFVFWALFVLRLACALLGVWLRVFGLVFVLLGRPFGFRALGFFWVAGSARCVGRWRPLGL